MTGSTRHWILTEISLYFPMYRSLNEIDQTTRKAARGWGLPWGLADEAGKAVRALHQFQLDGVVSLLAAMRQFSCDDLRAHAPQTLGDRLYAPTGVLNPLLAGPSLADWLSIGCRGPVQLENMGCPMLLPGYLCVITPGLKKTLVLEWEKISVQVSCNSIKIDDTGKKSDVVQANVTCIINDDQGEREYREPHQGDVWVDDNAWRELERFAHLTYVEATEASRLAGAGAGLNDND